MEPNSNQENDPYKKINAFLESKPVLLITGLFALSLGLILAKDALATEKILSFVIAAAFLYIGISSLIKFFKKAEHGDDNE